MPLVGQVNDTIDLRRYATEGLERIEVLRGTASALYGSDALAGVVNLISRRPRKPFEGSVFAQYSPDRAIQPRQRRGSRRASIRSRVAVLRRATPCRTAFSTSGCRTNSGTAAPRTAASTVEGRPQPVGEPDRLDAQILAHELELVPERDLLRAVGAHDPPQHVAQLLEHAGGGRGVAVAHDDRDGVEAVEQEVRLELDAERAHPRLGELGLETGGLGLALARLDEVEQRVLDAQHREVDRHPNGSEVRNQSSAPPP